jgi:hypothetical protein
VLLTEGPQVRLNSAGEVPVLLLKSQDEGAGRVLAVINPGAEAADVPIFPEAAGGSPGEWRELTPERDPVPWPAESPLTLGPYEVRLFYHPALPPLTPPEVNP